MPFVSVNYFYNLNNGMNLKQTHFEHETNMYSHLKLRIEIILWWKQIYF